MSTQTQLPNSNEISTKRLWFGFTGGAAAWVVAGLLDVIFASHACMGKELGNGMPGPTGMRILLGFITFGLLAVAVAGALISFRNWQRLSKKGNFVEAEGRARKTYMALSGVLVNTVLALGIVWFSIPIYVLSICQRAR